MKKRETFSMLTPLAQLATYALLIAAVLFLVFVGSRLYQKATAQKTENERLRSTVAYLQNQFNANDTARGVQIGQGPEGDALIFPMEDARYALTIYTYEGTLLEEMKDSSLEPDPARAEKISEVTSFAFCDEENGTFHFRIDGHDVWVTMQSLKGGEAHG